MLFLDVPDFLLLTDCFRGFSAALTVLLPAARLAALRRQYRDFSAKAGLRAEDERLVAAVEGAASGAKRAAKDPQTEESVPIEDMTFQEWEAWKRSGNPAIRAQEQHAAAVEAEGKEAYQSFEKITGSVDNKLKYQKENDIIQLQDKPMFRKHQTRKVEPMPKKLFRKIEKRFKAQGGL